MTERTFSIIKPDATRRNLTGKINARFEEKGLRIVAQRRIWMSRQQAEQFLAGHREVADVLAARVAVVQVDERVGALAAGQHTQRELSGHVGKLRAAHAVHLSHLPHPPGGTPLAVSASHP